MTKEILKKYHKKMMRLRIEEIPSFGLELELKKDLEWLEGLLQEEKEVGFCSPLSGRISIFKSGRKVFVSGEISIDLQIDCSRCLERFSYPLNSDFSLTLLPPMRRDVSSEIELKKEDLELNFYEGEEISISQIIREQIILSLPLNPICKASCQGLCPQCGSNLNLERCSCKGEFAYAFTHQKTF